MPILYPVLAAAWNVALHSGALKPEPAFHALAQLSGANTAIETSRVCLITNADDWKQLWKAHRASFQIGAPASKQDDDSDRPKIDFTKTSVVCLFGGQSKNVGGFTVTDSGDADKDAYIRVDPTLLPYAGTTLLQNPYIFITIPKTKKKIIVQLNEAPLGREGWRTLAEIQPPK